MEINSCSKGLVCQHKANEVNTNSVNVVRWKSWLLEYWYQCTFYLYASHWNAITQKNERKECAARAQTACWIKCGANSNDLRFLLALLLLSHWLLGFVPFSLAISIKMVEFFFYFFFSLFLAFRFGNTVCFTVKSVFILFDSFYCTVFPCLAIILCANWRNGVVAVYVGVFVLFARTTVIYTRSIHAKKDIETY